MKIKSITIEGMQNVLEKTYTFNNLNYLYGPNGAGKSTVLKAIQLALLGYIPGIDKKNAAIYRHARSKTLSVTCVLDSEGKDIKITRTWVGTGKTVTRAVDISPEGFKIEDILAELELPIFNFNAFVSMTANELKKWFINFLPSADGEIDWEKELKTSLGDMKVIDSTLLESTLSDLSTLKSKGVELVKQFNDHLKGQLTLQKSNLERTQKTIESLILYDDCDRDDIDNIRSEISKLQQNLAKASRIENIRNNNEKIKAMLSNVTTSAASLEEDEEYKSLTVDISNYQNKVNELDESLKNLRSKESDVLIEISTKQAIFKGDGLCPYTKSSCETIDKLKEEMMEEVKVLEEQRDTLHADVVNLSKEIFDLNSKINEANKRKTAIANDYSTKSQLESQLQIEEFIDGEEASSADILVQINELQDILTKAAANKSYNEMADKLTTEKFKIENTIEVLKVWIKLTDANNLQTKMMKAPFEDMESDMNMYLHKMFSRDDISAKFNLSEKANSFNFGVVRDDKYISFDLLSSGEKCLYTLALMMFIVKRSACPLKLIMIDDLLDHLDDENASQLFETLVNVDDIQLILAGVKKYNSDNFDASIIEVN